MDLTKEDIEAYKKAGSIVKEALAYGKGLVKPGKNMLETLLLIEKKIRELGGEPAFPAQVSIDNIAAHWCPDPGSEAVFEEGQLVKLDIGVHIDGRIADTAVSIDLSKDGKHAALIKAAEDARDAALKIMRPGTTLGEIGRVIQDTITAAGFSPILNLSGHGLGDYDVHTEPGIPNFDTGDATELEEGMVVAVEPFATTGNGKVYEQDEGNIYSLLQRRPVRSPYARNALRIIEKNYSTLPFCLHWLASEMGVGQAKLAMRELIRAEAVQVYPPLPEAGGGIVSQAEHSVIILPEPIVFTR